MMMRVKNVMAIFIANIFSKLRTWVRTLFSVRPAFMIQGGAGKA
jgi:hypothetical protein